jgi:hypothetical protein
MAKITDTLQVYLQKFFIVFHCTFLELKKTSEISRKNQHMQFISYIFFSKNHAVYGVSTRNMIKLGRSKK